LTGYFRERNPEILHPGRQAVGERVAEKAESGSVLLAMLPDTGERCLSTPLFDNIVEEKSEDEIALSKSAPGYQMP
jgi:cysteine synthase A